MGCGDGALRTGSFAGCTRRGGPGRAARACSSPAFGVCHSRGASLCFHTPPTFWPLGSLEGHTSSSLGLLRAANRGCFMPQPPAPLAWSRGAGGFSGSEAPRRAETRSSCLSDPQVKDEDKSLAVKRPGKEDWAVSVAGHGQGEAVSGMGLVLSRGQTLCQDLGASRRVVGSAPPCTLPVPGSAGGSSRAACGGRWVFLAGMPCCQHPVISPCLSPRGLSLPCRPQWDGGFVPTLRLQHRLPLCPPKPLVEKTLRLALRVAERLPVPEH